jgi:hypothetical protein
MAETAELTISVPEAGRRYFNMSRGTAYEAAHRGDIPTIKIGRSGARIRTDARPGGRGG